MCNAQCKGYGCVYPIKSIIAVQVWWMCNKGSDTCSLSVDLCCLLQWWGYIEQGNGDQEGIATLWVTRITRRRSGFLPTAREGNIFRCACLFTGRVGHPPPRGRPPHLEADTARTLEADPSQYWYLVVATAAVSTHPTGMHSCHVCVCVYVCVCVCARATYYRSKIVQYVLSKYQFFSSKVWSSIEICLGHYYS